MKHNYSRFTKDEENFLKNNYGKIPAQKIAFQLNKSQQAIYDKASRMGLTGEIIVKWTAKEIEFLNNNRIKFTFDQLSKKLNKPATAIQAKWYKLTKL